MSGRPNADTTVVEPAPLWLLAAEVDASATPPAAPSQRIVLRLLTAWLVACLYLGLPVLLAMHALVRSVALDAIAAAGAITIVMAFVLRVLHRTAPAWTGAS